MRETAMALVDAMKYAILTDKTTIPAETRQKLWPLLEKYL